MTKSGKNCGKSRNCTFCAISSFVTMFSKSCLLQRRQKASIWGKGLIRLINPFQHTKALWHFYSRQVSPQCFHTFGDLFRNETLDHWFLKPPGLKFNFEVVTNLNNSFHSHNFNVCQSYSYESQGKILVLLKWKGGNLKYIQ